MMKRWGKGRLGVLVAVGWSCMAWGQARPTATQTLDLSFFGGGTLTYTELDAGRNVGITAGGDVTFRELYFHVRPALEIRGNYAFKEGTIDGLKSAMAGPRFSREFGRFTPYVTGFYGRGSIHYVQGVVVFPPNGGPGFRYDRTTSNVFAGGAGVDYRVTRHFDAKADVLFEQWKTPVIDSGKIYPIPITVGVVYHLDFNHYGHKTKRDKRKKGAVDAAPAP